MELRPCELRDGDVVRFCGLPCEVVDVRRNVDAWGELWTVFLVTPSRECVSSVSDGAASYLVESRAGRWGMACVHDLVWDTRSMHEVHAGMREETRKARPRFTAGVLLPGGREIQPFSTLMRWGPVAALDAPDLSGLSRMLGEAFGF